MEFKPKLIKMFWMVLILCVLVCYSVSPAQAEEWQTVVNDTRITSSGATYDYYPSLGVDGLGNIHIAWTDERNGNWEIYYTKLDNDGNTIVEDTRLTSEINESLYPSLALDYLGNVHITWNDFRDGYWEIYYTKLDNNGNTIIDDKRLTFDISIVRGASLEVDDGGNVHIAWMDERDGNEEIYYTKLDNNGATLLDDTRLTSDISHSVSPNLGIDGLGNIHVAWLDGRVGWAIFYKKLNNNGVTLVDDKGFTFNGYPILGIDGLGNIHIVWNDGRHGNGKEIYYIKGTTTTKSICTDTDGDGYYVEGGDCGLKDCDDTNPNINPGTSEAGRKKCKDGIDNDCNGLIDCSDSNCAITKWCK